MSNFERDRNMSVSKYNILVEDIYLFNTGEAQMAYKTFGCHYDDKLGAHRFCVWAPSARAVSVVGDFNNWDPIQLSLIHI